MTYVGLAAGAVVVCGSQFGSRFAARGFNFVRHFAVRGLRGSRFAVRGSRFAFRAWRFAVRGSFRACAHNYVVKALVHFESCSQTFVSKRARLHEHVCAIIWKVAELAAMEALAYLESFSQTFALKPMINKNAIIWKLAAIEALAYLESCSQTFALKRFLTKKTGLRATS